jgi:hypothetical protein
MLWRMPADSPMARIGIMLIHFNDSANAGSANCANCANPCMHCRRNPSPYSGTKEFPVAKACAGALLFRIAGHPNRRRVAEIAETPPQGITAGTVTITSRITLGSVT